MSTHVTFNLALNLINRSTQDKVWFIYKVLFFTKRPLYMRPKHYNK